AKFSVRKTEPTEEMRLFERRLQVEPALRLQRRQIAVTGRAQRPIDDFARRHGKGRVFGADALRDRGDHLVVRAASSRRLDRLRSELEVLMASGRVNVVVLEKHRRRKNNVGIAGGVGHELLMNANEQVVARKAAPDLLL